MRLVRDTERLNCRMKIYPMKRRKRPYNPLNIARYVYIKQYNRFRISG